MSETTTCGICGEPMPPGEEMFKYHGFSGPCPVAPKPKPVRTVMVTYVFRDDDSGLWIDIEVETRPYDSIGPFVSAEARRRAHDDLLEMMRSQGAKDCGSA